MGSYTRMYSIQVESWAREEASKEVTALERQGECKVDVMRNPYMGALREWQRVSFRQDWSRRTKRRRVFKAIVILVISLIDDYVSSTTTTSHIAKIVDKIPAPAFTFCPKPSLKSSFQGNSNNRFSALKNASVSLTEFISHAPFEGLNFTSVSSANGETIFLLVNGSWSERTFWEVGDVRKPPEIFKCFTLALRDEMPAGTTNRVYNSMYFIFDFTSILKSKHDEVGSIPLNWIQGDVGLGNSGEMISHFVRWQIPSLVEVYIHEQAEKFSNLGLMAIENALVFNNTTAKLFIRSDYGRKLKKRRRPCTMDKGHSYVRCMENCFWGWVQSRPQLPCLDPILITKEVDLTKPVCSDPNNSKVMLEELEKARKYFVDPESEIGKNCSCPKRCHRSIYYIFPDPNSNGFKGSEFSRNTGSATLFFNFPSRRVSTFVEQEKTTILELLSDIGGIVGICLGVSIVTIFDLVDGACSRIRCKLLYCRKKIIQGSNH
ncbi:unnamed protein product [Darwinula stevensoni]|uniref:Uncharacterized protein n=1 Tax=Darwinula stevensoni TaxID=69355 RepID=A0A7R9A9U5_9CRUS|nr:unnamed protein product [Darwinula stevensoni]CAG0897749.1 unnamed protein product [Darwinula stevensoni]